MKREYQAIIIYRSGTRQYAQGVRSFKTKAKAMESIREVMKSSNIATTQVGAIGITIEKSDKKEPYDIVGYEIRSRQVTDWTVEEIN